MLTQTRYDALVEWAVARHPPLADSVAAGGDAVAFQYGVYSETPDFVPIVGFARPDSRICYLQGCNACGQAALSFAAGMVPALLGYGHLDELQAATLQLFTVTRFPLLPALLGGAASRL